MEEEIKWKAEAEAIIKDVGAHTKTISISAIAPPSKGIYLNITTFEDQHLCVLLNASGFQVVGKKHNDSSLEGNSNQTCYETPYALLRSVSSTYDESFGNLLIEKLNKLKNQADSET